MLARVADSLYWMGRYIERAEHHCRLADVMLSAVLDQNEAAVAFAQRSAGWGVEEGAASGQAEGVRAHAFLLDREDPASVVSSLSRARENARQVRDQVTTETWERLNLVYLRVNSANAERAVERAPSTFLHGVITDLHLFNGAVDATMSHGEGWRFLLLGVYLERAQLIARLLNVCFGGATSGPLEDHLTQMSVLRMACALEPYLRVYTAELEPRHILEFLVFDEEFPRSIRFSIRRMEDHLTNLGRPIGSKERSLPERLAARLSGRLEFADLEKTSAPGALLGAVARECTSIHDAIYETFVRYPLQQRLLA